MKSQRRSMASAWIVRAGFVALSYPAAVVLVEGLGRSEAGRLGLIGPIIAAALVAAEVVSFERVARLAVAAGLGVLAGGGAAALAAWAMSVAFGLSAAAERGVFAVAALVFSFLFIMIGLRARLGVPPWLTLRAPGQDAEGPLPLLLDTSAIIDGRLADVAETGLIDGPFVVPRFVLEELQAVADSSDRLKRSRGRRGIEILERLQASQQIRLVFEERDVPGVDEVDGKLVKLARQLPARLITGDFNLNKLARLQNVPVININDLANALKPVILPGEQLTLKLAKAGEEAGQAVGYLDDGTMVVVEDARERIGAEVQVDVTSAIQTSAGRMIFGRITGPNT